MQSFGGKLEERKRTKEKFGETPESLEKKIFFVACINSLILFNKKIFGEVKRHSLNYHLFSSVALVK